MKFNEKELSEPKTRLVLYAICLRLAPFFRDFSNKFSIENPEQLDECLCELEEEIINNKNFSKFCQKWIPRLELSIPDMDDFNSELLPSLALDSITATLTTLDYLSTYKIPLIDEVLSISLNSAEFVDESIDEFISFYPKPNKSAVSLEFEFIEKAKFLAASAAVDITADLKKLVSEYSYQ